MKPFLTEEQFHQGELITRQLMPELAKLDPVSCVAGLSMALVFAADAAEVPLPSVGEFMRQLRKGFQELQSKVDSGEKSKLIVVP